jgi:asparagine synthase (glutamine-hydrolysing)
MCGIAGHFSKTKLSINKQAVLVSLAHRGPDAQAFWEENNCLLFHSRLSIIDTDSRSNQPFRDPTGRYTLVFNGEIYNYKELKSMLNIDWQTTSDTELLLHWLINFGVSRINELDGMFAFAFYDSFTKDLIVARDRFGKKPFYYHMDNDTFSFASEVRVLMHMHPELNKISKQQLSNWLFWQTIPGGCLIEGIEELEPGYYYKLSKQQIIVKSTYLKENPYLGIQPTREEALSNVKERVINAVEKRLVADVPFAAFLSGGIDSSIIVGVASKFLGKDFHTFSMSFDESLYSEHHIANQVAKHHKTKHHEIRLKPNDFLDILPEGLAATDHPRGDGLNTYAISKYTQKKGFKMALSGIGGDEWFLGYPYFRKMDFWRKKSWSGMGAFMSPILSFKHRKGLEIARAVNSFGGNGYAYQRILFDQTTIKQYFKLGQPTILPPRVRAEFSQSVYSMQEWEFYLQPVILRDSDQFSMAVGLEIRNPFMDDDLVDYSLALSDAIKLGHRPKDLLITAFESELPRSVYNRPKQGFTLPWEHWMKNELKSFCETRIVSFANRLEMPQIEREWRTFLQSRSQFSWSRLWSIVAIEDWLARNNIIIE